MKKLLITVAAMLSLGLASSAFADMKIGVLDINKVLLASPQVAAAKEKLKKQFGPREQEIVDARKKLQSDIEDYNKNGSTMKADVQKDTQSKIMDEQKKLQEMEGKFQTDVNSAQTTEMQSVLKKVESIVNRIAADKKFDLILTKVSTAFNKPEFEVTDAVIKEIKK
jgi:outer membrane protein